jgi:hypothetical protein
MTIAFDVLWQNPEFKEEMRDVIAIFFRAIEHYSFLNKGQEHCHII